MGTVRAWWPQLLRAGGAAVLVPAAILVALLVLGAGGGLGGLGSLSQLFSGPNVPPPLRAAARYDMARADRVALPRTGFARPAPTAGSTSASTRAGGGGRAGGARATSGTVARTGAGAGGRRASVGSSSTSPGGSTQAASPAASAPAAAASPAPGSQPTLLDGLTKPVTRIVGALPAPLGPVGSGAISAVVTTVDKLLKPR